jgi:hypothetical protein
LQPRKSFREGTSFSEVVRFVVLHTSFGLPITLLQKVFGASVGRWKGKLFLRSVKRVTPRLQRSQDSVSFPPCTRDPLSALAPTKHAHRQC